MKNMFIVSMAFVVLAAIAFSAMPASAEIILYQDSLSRGTVDVPADLNTSAPDVAYNGYGASADATWVASSIWDTNGTLATVKSGTTTGANAFLPFTPEAGYVYTFSATVQAVSSSNTGRWISMGFSESASTGTAYPHAGGYNLGPWAYFRVSTAANPNDFWTGPNTTGKTSIGTDTGELDVEFVLDTTGALWSYECVVEGSSKVTGTYVTNPTINYLHFGTVNDTTVTFDNVLLTVNAEVPEPSAIALLATGLIGLLAYAWRKRK